MNTKVGKPIDKSKGILYKLCPLTNHEGVFAFFSSSFLREYLTETIKLTDIHLLVVFKTILLIICIDK